MIQLRHIHKLLAAVFFFALVGCSSRVAPKLANNPPRFVNPDGSVMNVAPDGTLLEGVLIARCTITEEGNVEECEVTQNPFATKNEAFVTVLQKQTFTPAMFEGKPQRINYTFRIRFKADEYTQDLRNICRVHEITGKSPELGVQAVAPWLTDNIKTKEARSRLGALPNSNIPVWMQSLRREAAAKGISPCPFADYWEEFSKRPPSDSAPQ